MKFNPSTISKPVVGSEAIKISKAIEDGDSITNEQSNQTLLRILERRRKAKAIFEEVKALVEAKNEWVRKVQAGEIVFTKGKRIA